MQKCMTRRDDTLAGHWDDVRVFLGVLRAGTFSKAARQLGMEQSTVSRRIQNLETVLGHNLFERGARLPLPTDAASQLRAAAEAVEAEFCRFSDTATRLHGAGSTGQVTVALTEELAVHVVVPQVLPRLRESHPGVSLKLLTSYDAADLAGREADVALRFFQTSRGDLIGKRIATLQLAVLASRSYAKRALGRPLQELDWVAVNLPGVRTSEGAWLDELSPNNCPVVCNSYQVQLAAIRSGLGVGLGPALYATIDPRVVAIPTPAKLPPLQLYLLTRRSIRKVDRVAAVLDELERAFSQLSGA